MKTGQILAAIGMAAGLIILFIPFITDIAYKAETEQKIRSMSETLDRYNNEETERQKKNAEKYNKALYSGGLKDEKLLYEEQLSAAGEGVMSELEIPCINMKMLVYHGSGADVLSIGCGHLEGSSLPVGGESTHCVLTGHSGMKNMRAFDDIRSLKTGDMIYLNTLGEEMAYKVYETEVVLPEETESLKIQEGKDMLTLVTCTPYGVNDHRLLVHAKRDKSRSRNKESPAVNILKPDIRTTPPLLALIVIPVVIVVIILKRKRA